MNLYSVIVIKEIIVFMLSEYGLCSVSLNNKLYLVGGQTTITDCYDPERDEWRQLSMMERMECGAVVINGYIYVTGGYSYSKEMCLQSIEKYDPELDTWEVVGNLRSPASTHGCIWIYSVLCLSMYFYNKPQLNPIDASPLCHTDHV